MKYRRGVIAVIQAPDQSILVGSRAGQKNSWQLPQGGIDPNEEPGASLKRELFEEVGLESFSIENRLAESISYDFPKSVNTKIAKKYAGQSLYWYHLQVQSKNAACLNRATDQEFSDLDWRTPEQIISGIIVWKQEFYKQGFKLLGFNET